MKKIKKAAAIVSAVSIGAGSGALSTVAPAFATENVATAKKSISVPEKSYKVLIDEDTTLSAIDLPENWKFKEPNSRIEEGSHTYTAVFTGDRSQEYEQSTDDMEITIDADVLKDPDAKEEVRVPKNAKVSDAGIGLSSQWRIVSPNERLQEGENRIEVAPAGFAKYIGKNAERYVTVKAVFVKVPLEIPQELPEIERTLNEGQSLNDLKSLGSVRSPVSFDGERPLYKVVISSTVDKDKALKVGTYTYEISIDVPEDQKEAFDIPVGKLRVVVKKKHSEKPKDDDSGKTSGSTSQTSQDDSQKGQKDDQKKSADEPAAPSGPADRPVHEDSAPSVPSEPQTPVTQPDQDNEDYDAEVPKDDLFDVSDVAAKPLSGLISKPKADTGNVSDAVSNVNASSIVKASDIAKKNDSAAKKAEAKGDDVVVGNSTPQDNVQKAKNAGSSAKNAKKAESKEETRKSPVALIVAFVVAAAGLIGGFIFKKKKDGETESPSNDASD